MNRLFKDGLITTICGLVIILTGVLTWSFSEVTATEAGIIAGIGMPLLFLKDSHVGINKGDSCEK